MHISTEERRNLLMREKKTCLIESKNPSKTKTKSRFYQILIKGAKLVKISLPCVQVISVFLRGDATDWGNWLSQCHKNI